MDKKYTPAESSRIYSNDLYFAALLHSQGYEAQVIRNARKRVSFAFTSCTGVLAVREAYRGGKVMVDMRAFRESLYQIRRMMDSVITEERSISYAHVSEPSFVAARRQPILQPVA
jgi:hypothetical protein